MPDILDVPQYAYTLPPGVFLIRSRVPEAPFRMVSGDPNAGRHVVLVITPRNIGPDGLPTHYDIQPPPDALLGAEQGRYQGAGMTPPHFFVPPTRPNGVNIFTSHPAEAVPLFFPDPRAPGLWVRGTGAAAPMPLVPLEDETLSPPGTLGVGLTLLRVFDALTTAREAAPEASASAQGQIPIGEPANGGGKKK